MKKPKILFYDIETSPNLAYVWGKYEQNVIAYEKEWELLSVAYKWKGEKTVHCITRDDYRDTTDKSLTKDVLALFKEADIIVGHNNDNFDQKKVQARFIFHGFEPPKFLNSVDTKKIAKRHFNFNSNSLNDLGQYLGLGKKVETGGFQLWLDCMNGSEKAWKKMKKYNKQDVVLLEKVYEKFLPWVDNHPNFSLVNKQKDELLCPVCLSENIKFVDIYFNARSIKQINKCEDCSNRFYSKYKR